jgi:hypothetical protein
MPATSPWSSEPDDGSVTVTARHMADAVGYLTRVANNAGLRGIAGKLTNVRTSLLKVVEGGADEDEPAESAARSATRSATRSGGASKADEDGNDDG